MRLAELRRRAKEYVELETSKKVESVRFRSTFRLFGREDVVLLVKIKDRRDPFWWVVGGGTPMNLYSCRQYPEPGSPPINRRGSRH